MTKLPGVTSDGNFSSCLIRRSEYTWLFPFPVGGNGNYSIYPLLSTVLTRYFIYLIFFSATPNYETIRPYVGEMKLCPKLSFRPSSLKILIRSLLLTATVSAVTKITVHCTPPWHFCALKIAYQEPVEYLHYALSTSYGNIPPFLMYLWASYWHHQVL